MSTWSKWKSLRNKGKAPQSKNHATKHSNKPSENMRETQNLPHETPPGQPHTPEEEHRAKERQFWRDQITQAKWLNRITLGGAAIAIIGLIVLKGTLDVTKRAVGDARFATEEANRASVSALAPEFYDKVGIGKPVHVAFFFNNDGRGPATDARIGVIFDTIKKPSGNDYSKQIRVPENLCPQISQSEPTGVLYHIGQSDRVSLIKLYTRDSKGNRVLWSDKLQSGEMTVRIRGCLSYKTFKQRRHVSLCFVFGPAETNSSLGPQYGLVKLGVTCVGGNWAD